MTSNLCFILYCKTNSLFETSQCMSCYPAHCWTEVHGRSISVCVLLPCTLLDRSSWPLYISVCLVTLHTAGPEVHGRSISVCVLLPCTLLDLSSWRLFFSVSCYLHTAGLKFMAALFQCVSCYPAHCWTKVHGGSFSVCLVTCTLLDLSSWRLFFSVSCYPAHC